MPRRYNKRKLQLSASLMKRQSGAMGNNMQNGLNAPQDEQPIAGEGSNAQMSSIGQDLVNPPVEMAAYCEESGRKLQQEIESLKSQLRTMEEEKNQLKSSLYGKNAECNDYRAKFNQSEQKVEELIEQINNVQIANNHFAENIRDLEIQKMDLEEKLSQLSATVETLQNELTEARRKQRMTDNELNISWRQMRAMTEKLREAYGQLDIEKRLKFQAMYEVQLKSCVLGQKEWELDCFESIVEENKAYVTVQIERMIDMDRKYKEKTLECAYLMRAVDEQKMLYDSALSSNKEKTDRMLRSMNSKLSELQRQLTEAWAYNSTQERQNAQLDMGIQGIDIRENFHGIDERIRMLQSQLQSLRNSFAALLANDANPRG